MTLAHERRAQSVGTVLLAVLIVPQVVGCSKPHIETLVRGSLALGSKAHSTAEVGTKARVGCFPVLSPLAREGASEKRLGMNNMDWTGGGRAAMAMPVLLVRILVMRGRAIRRSGEAGNRGYPLFAAVFEGDVIALHCADK